MSNQYGPPPNVTIVQKKSGCGMIALVLLILCAIGTVLAVLLMGGCLAVLA